MQLLLSALDFLFFFFFSISLLSLFLNQAAKLLWILDHWDLLLGTCTKLRSLGWIWRRREETLCGSDCSKIDFLPLFSLQPKTAKLVEIDFFRKINSSWDFNPSLATGTDSLGGHFGPKLVASRAKVLEISFFPPETALIWCNWFLHPEQLSHCTFFICSLSKPWPICQIFQTAGTTSGNTSRNAYHNCCTTKKNTSF